MRISYQKYSRCIPLRDIICNLISISFFNTLMLLIISPDRINSTFFLARHPTQEQCYIAVPLLRHTIICPNLVLTASPEGQNWKESQFIYTYLQKPVLYIVWHSGLPPCQSQWFVLYTAILVGCVPCIWSLNCPENLIWISSEVGNIFTQ